MSQNNVSASDMPRFTFRSQQFWDLPPETIQEIFDLGVKSENVIEKVTEAKQMERFFRKIDYYYRQLAEK